MSYNEELQSNNAELEEILRTVNELPEAGGNAEGDFTDPDYVYAVTRPKDWLPMPTPGDDEVYLLNLIPEGLDGAFTAQINYTGNCTIEFGNLVDGVFVEKESLSPTSKERFWHTVRWEDYGDTTADGYRQYIVRIKGAFTQALLYPENDTVFSYGQPMLVDAVIGREADTRFGINNTAKQNCKYLRYARFVGNGSLSYCGTAFRSCISLKSVYSEKQHSFVSANYVFDSCSSLVAVSDAFFPENATYFSAFKDSSFVPRLKKKIKPTNAGAMFRGVLVPVDVDLVNIDTSQSSSFSNFTSAAALDAVKNLDISSAMDVNNIFLNVSLYELTFAGETTPGGWTISLTSCRMRHEQLVNMINSLPTATTAATITITGNPGASELTDEEIAVATAKNWTVTI